jgi:thioredoxin reductase (NADPH)
MNAASKKYDIVIIGGGPAGLCAGMYAARSRLATLLIERGAIGGQVINTQIVENYPGFPDGISGIDLTELMHKQAEKFGMETLIDEVTGVELSKDPKTITTAGGSYKAKAVIIASGSERQKLGVPGEAEFTGRGVSYCATCDGAFFRDKPVAVVGGGNAAITEALELTRFASKISVIHRRDELRATKILQEKALAEPKIEVLWNSVMDEVTGDTFVDGIKLSNVKTKEKSVLNVAGVFMAIGFKPNTEYLQGAVELDKNNAVITDEKMATNVPGVYAVGDIRSNSIRQVIAATGDGAVAAVNAEKYIAGL